MIKPLDMIARELEQQSARRTSYDWADDFERYKQQSELLTHGVERKAPKQRPISYRGVN